MTQRACVAGSDARRDRAGGPPARPGSMGRTRTSRGSVSRTELLPGGMGSLLLGFGLASAVGVALAGRVTRPAAGLVVASAATAVGLIGLLRASEAALGLVAILGLGVASGALPPLAQTEILRRAGTHTATWPHALIPSCSTAASLSGPLQRPARRSSRPIGTARARGRGSLVAAVGLAAAVRPETVDRCRTHGVEPWVEGTWRRHFWLF